MPDIFGHKHDPRVDRGECFNRVARVLQRIRFPGYTFHADRTPTDVALRVTYNEPDVVSGVNEQQYGRRWIIEPDWNEAQIAQTALKAVLTSMEHRTREHFTLDGKAIFNPHHTLEQLLELAEGQERVEDAQEIQFS